MIKKLRAGKFLIPVEITQEGDRLALQFKYNKRLLAEVKSMEGAKWHGYEDKPRKIWTIKNSPRNQFQLSYLAGDNPYAPWEGDIVRHDYERDLYEHQKEITDFILARHYSLVAAEMGVGKSRCIIEALNLSSPESCWWIAPKSALLSVEKELEKWGCSIQPRLLTYEKLVRIMKDWEGTAPQFVVFDESSRVKNYTAQRSQAAMALANGVREDWGSEGFTILMSGTPAPKSPVDWFWQSEVACPGFLKEGNVHKFKQRLAFIVERETFAGGGMYKHVLSWRDDENKCDICGEFESEHNEDTEHKFKKSKNEVALLHERLAGLTLVKFKKDCLDLPDKIYRVIELPPTQQILQVAKTIVETSPTVISGLIRLRELSDGFQYDEIKIGKETCPVCKGEKRTPDPLDSSTTCICDGCGGSGTRPVYKRVAEQVPTPKERALVDLLDEYSDVGRLVIYAAFTGSIDRIIEICKASGWATVRMDGRGVESSIEGDPITNFQEKLEEHPKVCFVGQPSSSGYGLTLTASPAIIYWSNDYNVESRLQSEDRIHRIGCKGAMIIDLYHLSTDKLVHDCIKKKKRLQDLTLGEVREALNVKSM
jgi:SNF2 family DNA or RNA helicase